eukprot:jgi/Ulvmu1/7041/UM033_0101.1
MAWYGGRRVVMGVRCVCRALRDRVQRLQAVHDKFRAVVDQGERMPGTWSEAKPQHRQAFENFFAGWKPLPPSMSQPQRKLQARTTAEGAARAGVRRAPPVKVEDAPVTRATTTTRARSTGQHKLLQPKAADPPPPDPKLAPAPQQEATPAEAVKPALPAAATAATSRPAADSPQPASAPPLMHPQPLPPVEGPACMGVPGIADVSQLRAWAVLNGLGQAVPISAPHAQAHVAASFAAHSQQIALMQLQMQAGFGSGSVLPASAGGGFSSPMHAAAIQDALASLHLPPHALFAQPQHGGGAAVAYTTAGAPRPAALPPSPFLTTLDLPQHQLPTAETLLHGTCALPPPLSLKTHEAGTASVNDSARSCLTAAGSTPTAVDRPTLSRLLSNPVFAVPMATGQAGAAAAATAVQAEHNTAQHSRRE